MKRFSIRSSTMFLRPQTLAARPLAGTFHPVPRPPLHPLSHHTPTDPSRPPVRTYVATSQSSPGHSSNVTNPQGASIESKQVNESRATDSQSSPDTASVQTPVSDPSSSGLGQQEEQQPAMEQLHRDPNEPDEKKREHVEKMGQKPLDAADK